MTHTLTKSSQRRGGHKFSKWDNASPEDRFWAKVDKTPGQGPDGECWGWVAGTVGKGYGQFSVGDERILAHRFSYELHHGPIPEGMQIRHTCDNPPCSNPDHLVLGTNQDNVDDRVKRGRSAKCELHSRAKLTISEVLAIRTDPRPCAQIAAEYGVSVSTIHRIKAGTTWGHVPDLQPVANLTPRTNLC